MNIKQEFFWYKQRTSLIILKRSFYDETKLLSEQKNGKLVLWVGILVLANEIFDTCPCPLVSAIAYALIRSISCDVNVGSCCFELCITIHIQSSSQMQRRCSNTNQSNSNMKKPNDSTFIQVSRTEGILTIGNRRQRHDNLAIISIFTILKFYLS